MSYSKYGSGDSRRHSSSRRDSSPRRSRRSPDSPGPSRPRDPMELPESFGRGEGKPKEADDDLNILQRMKSSFENSPLQGLNECIEEKKKIKIWTRNYKEVRGILTGYLVAFDKHWNLILRDVDEVYLKPKKSKTPFLRDLEPNEDLPDMPAKVPRQKKTPAEGQQQPPPPEKKPETSGDGEKTEKKKKRKKKSKHISGKRALDQLFIRGDNIVMVCPFEMEEEEEEEEEEEQKSG